MAKVYGLHEITLKEEVKPEDFGKFVIEELNALPRGEGTDWSVLKGDKGDRLGRYLLMAEFESPGARDRLGRRDALKPQALQVWEKLVSMTGRTFTDYVVVE